MQAISIIKFRLLVLAHPLWIVVLMQFSFPKPLLSVLGLSCPRASRGLTLRLEWAHTQNWRIPFSSCLLSVVPPLTLLGSQEPDRGDFYLRFLQSWTSVTGVHPLGKASREKREGDRWMRVGGEGEGKVRLGREMNSLKVTFPTFDSFLQSACLSPPQNLFYCGKRHIT